MVYISSYDKLKGKLPKAIWDAMDQDSEKASMTDADVIYLAEPDSTDWELRLRICRIVEKAEDLDTIWVEDDFIKGICNRKTFRARMDNPWKRDFLIRPLHKFEQATDNLITSITARFYEIASLPIMTKEINGEKRVDHKNAKLMMDLAKLLLDRKLGTAVQRQVTLTAAVPGKLATPADVEKEIKALEAEFEDKRKIPSSTTGEEKTEGAAAVSGE